MAEDLDKERIPGVDIGGSIARSQGVLPAMVRSTNHIRYKIEATTVINKAELSLSYMSVNHAANM